MLDYFWILVVSLDFVVCYGAFDFYYGVFDFYYGVFDFCYGVLDLDYVYFVITLLIYINNLYYLFLTDFLEVYGF